MQTFVPYSNFARTARALDDKRLGKQRVETLQIFRALVREKYGYKHHPAVLMWKGYESALLCYGVAICDEWIKRGYKDTVRQKLLDEAGVTHAPTQRELRDTNALPLWLAKRAVKRSHRAALVKKLPEHYAAHFPDAGLFDDYVWPVRSSTLRSK
ncbi:MAG: MSMEG_6728 family protein [Actinomycetota bacterium]